MPAATCGMARDEAVAQGVTINGLVILSQTQLPWNPEHTNPPGGLEILSRTMSSAGRASFVIAAEGFESFGKALIIKKMIAEIAMPAATASRAPCVPAKRLRRFAAIAQSLLIDAPAADQKAFRSAPKPTFESFQLSALWNRSKQLNLEQIRIDEQVAFYLRTERARFRGERMLHVFRGVDMQLTRIATGRPSRRRERATVGVRAWARSTSTPIVRPS